MRRVAGGAGGSYSYLLPLTVDPVADEDEGSSREPEPLEGEDQLCHEVADHLLDRLRGDDGFGEAKRRVGRVFRDDRIERFSGPVQRLIEAGEQGLSEAAGQR